MSNQFYEIKWRDTIKKIQEVYSIEFDPLRNLLANPKQKFNTKGLYKLYSLLYTQYLQVFVSLNSCYENANHPQKKVILQQMLDNIIKRTLKVQNYLIKFNIQTKQINSDFINLEQILETENLILNDLDIPIPKFFSQPYTQQQKQNRQIVQQILQETQQGQYTTSHSLYNRFDPNKLTLQQAVLNIIKYEKIRQAIEKGQQEKIKLLQVYQKHHVEKQADDAQIDDNQESEQIIVVIQKIIRGFLQRKKFYQERINEKLFLGLSIDEHKQKILNQNINKVNQERNQNLVEMHSELKDNIYNIKKNLIENEGIFIKEKMMEERRKFIIDKFQNSKGKELPQNIQDFYKKDEIIETEDNKKGKKQDKKKQKNKKLTEEEQFLKERDNLGPHNSTELKNLKELIDRYQNEWGNQYDLNQCQINKEIIINQLFPDIKKEIQEYVDKIMQTELDGLYYKLNFPKKKTTQSKKKNTTKTPKIPGMQYVQNKDSIFILKELAQYYILRQEMPVDINNFLTSENILRQKIEEHSEFQPDPSLSQLKRTVIQHIILPIGSSFNPEQSNRTFLFYGPEGSGKTMMINSIIKSTGSIFLDISPYNIANVFTDKQSIAGVMYKVFKIAKEFQPAIIYFDETEHYFGKKNLKKLKYFAGKCAKFKKELNNQINKHLTLDDRVVIIGCTNKPQYVNVTDAKKFFYKKFYFPFPDYAARKEIFQKIIENHLQQYNLKFKDNIIEKLSPHFPIDLLAYHSEGFTIGTFKDAMDQILTPARIKRLEMNPLGLEEIIQKLSTMNYCNAEQYKQFKDFTQSVTGIKERQDKQKKLKEENSKKKKK